VNLSALCFLALAYTPTLVLADCPRFTSGTLRDVEFVHDGDSLRLGGGTQIRLVGINTPELGRGSVPSEPFAIQARRRLRSLVEDAGDRVRIEPAIASRDRYGRLLAHAYLADGRSLQELLLESGLGLAAPYPPNLAHLDCYLDAEAAARVHRRGLWRIPASRASDLRHLPGKSFVRAKGRVTRARRSRSSVWLDMAEDLSLRIARADFPHFDLPDLTALEGHTVEVRGWLATRREGQPARMRIRHPSALRRLD
jgi:endonuclease YncB( thermonuclease family)